MPHPTTPANAMALRGLSCLALCTALWPMQAAHAFFDAGIGQAAVVAAVNSANVSITGAVQSGNVTISSAVNNNATTVTRAVDQASRSITDAVDRANEDITTQIETSVEILLAEIEHDTDIDNRLNNSLANLRTELNAMATNNLADLNTQVGTLGGTAAADPAQDYYRRGQETFCDTGRLDIQRRCEELQNLKTYRALLAEDYQALQATIEALIGDIATIQPRTIGAANAKSAALVAVKALQFNQAERYRAAQDHLQARIAISQEVHKELVQRLAGVTRAPNGGIGGLVGGVVAPLALGTMFRTAANAQLPPGSQIP